MLNLEYVHQGWAFLNNIDLPLFIKRTSSKLFGESASKRSIPLSGFPVLVIYKREVEGVTIKVYKVYKDYRLGATWPTAD